MSTKLSRDDLRVWYDPMGYPYTGPGPYRKVTDEEFGLLAQEAGFVKAPQLSKGPSEMLGKLWVERNPGKALRALLTDECEPCKGTGQFLTYGVPCNECNGRGWLPKDGVFIEWCCEAPSYAKEYGGCNPGDDFYPHRHTLCRWQVEFPADWLEAEGE